MAGEKIIEQAVAGSPEKLLKPESQPGAVEQRAERPRPFNEAPREGLVAKKPVQPANIVASSQALNFQKQRAAEIDQILADGLHEVFLSLTPDKQQEFKKQGEETVAKINILLSQTKTKVGQIISLIKQWLRLIPGINKFFLEQEAKIKADRIMKIKNKF